MIRKWLKWWAHAAPTDVQDAPGNPAAPASVPDDSTHPGDPEMPAPAGIDDQVGTAVPSGAIPEMQDSPPVLRLPEPGESVRAWVTAERMAGRIGPMKQRIPDIPDEENGEDADGTRRTDEPPPPDPDDRDDHGGPTPPAPPKVKRPRGRPRIRIEDRGELVRTIVRCADEGDWEGAAALANELYEDEAPDGTRLVVRALPGGGIVVAQTRRGSPFWCVKDVVVTA